VDGHIPFICARILRYDADKIGFNSNFTIYDEQDTKALVTKCIEELQINTRDMTPALVKDVISKAKDNAIAPDDFAALYQDNVRYETIAKIYKMYQKKLKENNAMDFDDLLFHTLTLMRECPEVLEHYQNRFEYILIDEYQDTNHLQYEITTMIAQKKKNICVCGDDDQSIYGWRGADIRNILDFEEDYPDATVIRLEQNYRSTDVILKAANEVISNNESRKGKKLWTTRTGGEKIDLIQSSRDLEEADVIAREIEKLHNNQVMYGEMAVLYRINAQSRILEESLLRRGIPYQIIGGTRFYDRMEVKDILAYLKLSINRMDGIAFIRAIGAPKRGIGAASFEKLEEYAQFKNIDLVQACLEAEHIPTLSASARQKLSTFGIFIDALYETAQEESLHDAVEKVVKESGYMQMLQDGKLENKETRMENLHELINAAEEFEDTSEDASLEAFLENAALIAGADIMSRDEGQVLLMTMHNSKGLEFRVVFVPGLEEGIFPLPKAMENPNELEEERRLCYVAITRAMEKLYLSYAQYRKVFGSGEYRLPSRFLKEIPQDLIHIHTSSGNVSIQTTIPSRTDQSHRRSADKAEGSDKGCRLRQQFQHGRQDTASVLGRRHHCLNGQFRRRCRHHCGVCGARHQKIRAGLREDQKNLIAAINHNQTYKSHPKRDGLFL
jgi:DNA helicase-2/ATP-dependent DNA helicase PcrA